MNILCCAPPGGAFYHITEAWGRTFKKCGHKFAKWDGSINTWNRFNPNLYLGCSGHRQPIPKNRKCKVGIHVNPYSDEKLKPVNGVDINEPINAIKWTVEQRPDFVFGYGLQEQEPLWANYRRKHGIPWYGVPTAGDSTHYYIDPKAEYSGDIGFIGGRWAYKAHKIDRFLLPVLKKYKNKIRLFGWGGWEGTGLSWRSLDGQNKNQQNTNADRHIFSSCKICPAVAEPHTSIYNIDWPERIFKVPLCGAFTFSDPIHGYGKYLNRNVFPMAENPPQYMEIVDHYLASDDKRIQMAKKQRQFILDNHTYFHRVAVFFEAMGQSAEANRIRREYGNSGLKL